VPSLATVVANTRRNSISAALSTTVDVARGTSTSIASRPLNVAFARSGENDRS
jgi:hypothetical protein